MAPYCAIPRDYLSDTPALRAMGFLVSQHGQLGAIPPAPFLRVSPVESMRSGGAIPPLKRGISAILARYPVKTRQMGAIPPLCDTISKGDRAIGGGISHWAAKGVTEPVRLGWHPTPSIVSLFFFFAFDLAREKEPCEAQTEP